MGIERRARSERRRSRYFALRLFVMRSLVGAGKAHQRTEKPTGTPDRVRSALLEALQRWEKL